MIKKKYYYIISTILLFFFFINYYQFSNQHWSSIIDQDTFQIYNSLLVASGLEQEYRDHPAFTTFLIHGFVFKIINIFNNSFLLNIDSVLSSKNIDETFQHYFQIARITNYFINFFLIISFYNFLKKIRIDENLIIKIVILLLLSQGYVLSFFLLRSENLSLLLFLISSTYLISNNKNIAINIFISGVFLALAMLAKIQIIFLLPIYIFILVPFYSVKNLEYFYKIKKEKYFNIFLFLSFYLIFISWVLLQLFLQEHIRFSSNKYFDLTVMSLVFFIINIYYFFLSKNKFDDFKRKIITLSISVYGFGFCIILFLIADFFKIIDINKYIFLRISNPFHYMSEFTHTLAYGVVNINFFTNIVSKIFSNYMYSYLELILLVVALFFLYLKNNALSKNYIIKVILLVLFFLFLVFVNNLRYSTNYHTYYFIIYLLLFIFCINKLDYKIANLLLILSLFLTVFNNFYLLKDDYKNVFNRTSSLEYICMSENTNKKTEMIVTIKYWHSKINDDVIKKICKQN